jgi:hypothetical protein
VVGVVAPPSPLAEMVCREVPVVEQQHPLEDHLEVLQLNLHNQVNLAHMDLELQEDLLLLGVVLVVGAALVQVEDVELVALVVLVVMENLIQ